MASVSHLGRRAFSCKLTWRIFSPTHIHPHELNENNNNPFFTTFSTHMGPTQYSPWGQLRNSQKDASRTTTTPYSLRYKHSYSSTRRIPLFQETRIHAKNFTFVSLVTSYS
ncbi:hypothetical protein VNO77_03846 [Canavalia gladiata]|uniref:Uncharacterized protein n=1 Tax=Canavalia gladiata TaxID=3824 RepID=A0AAN9N145_CANGL